MRDAKCAREADEPRAIAVGRQREQPVAGGGAPSAHYGFENAGLTQTAERPAGPAMRSASSSLERKTAEGVV